jgi:hypothetical protein
VRDNLGFLREHAEHPVNFCRAEPYHGTALHRDTAARQQLGGSYLGWNYRIEDDRTELLFRIAAAAFRERNFAPQGVANRTMGLGYAAKLVEHFHGPSPEIDALWRRSQKLTRAISLETAAFLERALELSETVRLDDRDTIERQTALLGLEIAAADHGLHRALDELYGDMASVARQPAASRAPLRPPARLLDKVLAFRPSLALGMSLALAWTGCEDSVTVDPAPGDGGVGAGVVDPPPPDGGTGGFIADPPPPDGGVGGEAGTGGTAGAGGAGDTGGQGGMPADPPPWDSPVPKAPAKAKTSAVAAPAGARLALVDQWRDSAAPSVRTVDLPLHAPPKPSLRLERDGDVYLVSLEGVPLGVSTRWQADGPVVGEGHRVRWRPQGPADRIRVAVRSHGGVAVISAHPG